MVYAAGEQVFFSLGLASGQLMMYASYNKFSNNVVRFQFFFKNYSPLFSLLVLFQKKIEFGDVIRSEKNFGIN